MRNNNIEINVLIKGRPITEYAHNGKHYVEGRNNSNFEIELINHNAFPTEAIISVDGLSVIDGKDAGPNSSGYLLKGGEKLRIPGWKLTDKAVAAFQFAGKGQSYAQQSTGSARNTGVIGLIAYAGRGQYYQTYQPSFPQTSYSYGMGSIGLNQTVSSSITTLSATVGANSAAISNLGPTGPIGPQGPIGSSGYTNTATVNCVSPGVGINIVDQSYATASATSDMSPFSVARFYSGNSGATKSATRGFAPEPVKQTLGTAFGQQQNFNTETVSFNRGDMIAMSVLFYDDAKGLRARGIDLDRRRTHTPDAFPAMNCTPPKGWRG